MRERGLLRHAIAEAVIDLVGNEPDAAAPASRRDLRQAFGLQHGAGGIGGACDHEAGDPLVAARLLDLCRGGHPARGGIGRNRHRSLAERGENVAVAGIAGRRQGHPAAGIEQREKREHEARRRAGRHDHPLRFHIDAVAFPVMAGDALAQGGQAEGEGVSQRLAVERARHAIQRRARRRRAGLADLHVDDLVPQRFALRRGLHHVHHDEWRDLAATRGPQGGRRQVDVGLPLRHDRSIRRALKPPWLRPSRTARVPVRRLAGGRWPR